MIDLALATKNRKELFKKTIGNLNSQSISKKISLYIMDGNENNETQDFLSSKKFKFKKIEIYKDNQIKKIKKNQGCWPIIYNFLFEKGKSKYLTYWSDDILLKDKNAFEKAIERIEHSGGKTAITLFPFILPPLSKNPYLMISEIGIPIINYGIIKREAFEEVKGLDEKFKFFCADRDLSNKLFQKGYKTIINSDIIITHTNLKEEWRNPNSYGKHLKKARKRIASKWKKFEKKLINYNSIEGLFTKNNFYKTNKIQNSLQISQLSDHETRINFPEKEFKINKPKNKVRKFPKKLPGTFWGITTFFNPAGYKNKYQNYKIFRKQSKKQGLNLCAVELAFGKKPFELNKKDAEILIQIRGNNKNLMWQKERMMNIALENLPKNCDKVAWLDCDIIFKNNNWIKETSELLEEYCILQPFETCVWMPKNKTDVDVKKIPWGLITNGKANSRAKNISEEKDKKPKSYEKLGHVGFAWAGRKEIFDKIKFYDATIIGGGDLFMSDAFYDEKRGSNYKPIPKKTMEHYLKWRKEALKLVKGSVFYTKGDLLHLWHGERKDRNYFSRHFFLKEAKFNPEKDIKIGKNKLFEWSSKKPKLHQDIKKYFFIRNEEGDKKLSLKIKLKNKTLELKNKGNLYYHKTMGKIGEGIKKISPKMYSKLKTPKDKIESKLK